MAAKYEVYGIRHTYIVYNNASAYGFKRVYMTKACEAKIGVTTLEFSGDGYKFKKNYGYEADGTVEADVEDDQLDFILWNLPKVTPAGGDDFALRYAHGSDTELQTNYVEVRLTLDAADADTGAAAVVRYRFLRCQFSPDTPVKFATQAVAGRMLAWNTRKTLTDVIAASPTGMPARGCHWLKDFITDPTKFDPVPGDIL